MNIDRLCPGCMNDNGGEEICSICGYDMAQQNDKEFLPVKFVLSERYVIGKVLSSNTESVNYIAYDNYNEATVNVREYFPKSISRRNPDKTVSVISGNEFLYNEGLMDFIEINKKLISSELPSVISVLAVFEDNGTVYSVTPTFSGITLKNFLERNSGILRWEQVRPLFLPLIDTVKGLHEIGIIHGGISPESILVGRDGKLRLTGICIPRVRQASQLSVAELYNGFAAIEQYGKLDITLSPCSDVYAVSATLLYVLSGNVPPSSEARAEKDSLTIPAKLADELPRQVLVAIANGMQINVNDRTPDMDVFKNELVYGETKENIRRSTAKNTVDKKPVNTETKSEQKAKSVKYAVISCAVTAGAFLLIAAILCLTVFRKDIFGKNEPVNDNSDIFISSEEETTDDINPLPVDETTLYSVPDFTGKYYYEIYDFDEYDSFDIKIKGKEYSDTFERGEICDQSVAAGSEVQFNTEIQVTISLGPREIKLADVTGLEETEAKLELLKQGFLYENIEVVKKYDTEGKPGVVLEQSPVYGEAVNTESVVRIYVNSYQGELDGADLGDANTAE